MGIKSLDKYGSRALVAGASEGIGAAFSAYLAAAGMDLVLVARRLAPLEELAERLREDHGVRVDCITCDLSASDAAQQLLSSLNGRVIDVFVYNAALSFIGPFESQSPEHQQKIATTNMVTPMHLSHAFGSAMLERGRGAIVLMGSLAGFQGSGFLATYAGSKAFTRVFAESLWYEWRGRGVDVMACCAGATSTPNYLNTKPEKTSPLAPKVQTPEAVVAECFQRLGKKASFVTGRGNRVASFIMQKLMPRKRAIVTMGDTTRKMYRF